MATFVGLIPVGMILPLRSAVIVMHLVQKITNFVVVILQFGKTIAALTPSSSLQFKSYSVMPL